MEMPICTIPCKMLILKSLSAPTEPIAKTSDKAAAQPDTVLGCIFFFCLILSYLFIRVV